MIIVVVSIKYVPRPRHVIPVSITHTVAAATPSGRLDKNNSISISNSILPDRDSKTQSIPILCYFFNYLWHWIKKMHYGTKNVFGVLDYNYFTSNQTE